MKDKNVAAILALFLGGLGVHKFYLGRIGTGVLYLVFCFTVIPWVLGLIDFFVLALMDSDEFNARFNGSRTLPGPVVVNMLPPGPTGPYGPGPYPPSMQYGPGPGYAPPPQAGWGTPSAYPNTGPYPSTSPATVPPLSPDQLATQLEKLNELRISGILTEEEFAAQKAKLLDRM